MNYQWLLLNVERCLQGCVGRYKLWTVMWRVRVCVCVFVSERLFNLFLFHEKWRMAIFLHECRVRQLLVRPQNFKREIFQHMWTCSLVLMVALGERLVIIDSLCTCLFVWVRLLLKLVRLSFTCKDVSNDARGVFCDCDYWMMDDDYTDVLWSIRCEQWTPLYEKELDFANEICPGNDVRTGKQLEKRVQMRSIWRQNE